MKSAINERIDERIAHSEEENSQLHFLTQLLTKKIMDQVNKAALPHKLDNKRPSHPAVER